MRPRSVVVLALCLVFVPLLTLPTSRAVAQAGDDASGIRTVYLIRHGQYDSDEGADPDIGKALLPLGIAQARLVSARLQSLEVEFSSLLSSTMTRARQTAAVINTDFPLKRFISFSLEAAVADDFSRR